MKLQVRLTPSSKAKKSKAAKSKSNAVQAKKPKKNEQSNRETGVTAALSEHPLSTNVSSPIQATSKRRRGRVVEVEDDENKTLHANSYERDGFVASDNNEEEYSDDAFEPVRTIGIKRNASRRELGPPITTDLIMDSLSPNHRMIVEDFMRHAKQMCSEIRDRYSLRSIPFTDTILREMAIHFPKTQTELLRIPNINSEMVKRYGWRFLELIKQSKSLYESLDTTTVRGEGNASKKYGKNQAGEKDESEVEDAPIDPNHENVIVLDSDDEEDNGEFGVLSDDEVQGPGQRVRSSYFHEKKAPAVEELNSKWSLTQQQEAESKSKPDALSSKPWYGKSRADSDSGFRGNASRSHNTGRKGGIKKGTASKRGGGAFSGIGMMPT